MNDQLRKAAEMALEALLNYPMTEGKAIHALRQALAQPEQRENRMTDREAIQKALDTPHRRYSIEPHGNGYAIYRDRDLFHHGFNLGHLTEVTPETIELIENALNTTLAQPEQEPVAWLEYDDEGYLFLSGKRKGAFPVFTAPPSKPWVSLTDEDFDNIYKRYDTYDSFARAIEAKLKEKNT